MPNRDSKYFIGGDMKTMQLTCHADVEKMQAMHEEITGEENKEDAMHGSQQDPFDARVEQYTDEAKKDGEKLVMAMVDDPYHMLGEIFQISLNNTECDAGMVIKHKVMRLIEERALVFLQKQAD